MKKVYSVRMVFEVISEDDSQTVQKRIQALFDNGIIVDSFSEIHLEASNFEVVHVQDGVDKE